MEAAGISPQDLQIKKLSVRDDSGGFFESITHPLHPGYHCLLTSDMEVTLMKTGSQSITTNYARGARRSRSEALEIAAELLATSDERWKKYRWPYRRRRIR